jgi:hypothetical protein
MPCRAADREHQERWTGCPRLLQGRQHAGEDFEPKVVFVAQVIVVLHGKDRGCWLVRCRVGAGLHDRGNGCVQCRGWCCCTQGSVSSALIKSLRRDGGHHVVGRPAVVAKYMAKPDSGGPCGQSWGAFLRNHMPHIAAMDLFVVPTLSFNLLYVLVIVRLAQRELVWINVTAHPAAEWIAQQITEAFPWHEAPRYLIRDRDGIYGAAVTRRLRAMGIRDKPIAPGSPWQTPLLRG